jgi:hypothetical protein
VHTFSATGFAPHRTTHSSGHSRPANRRSCQGPVLDSSGVERGRRERPVETGGRPVGGFGSNTLTEAPSAGSWVSRRPLSYARPGRAVARSKRGSLNRRRDEPTITCPIDARPAWKGLRRLPSHPPAPCSRPGAPAGALRSPRGRSLVASRATRPHLCPPRNRRRWIGH